MGKYLKQIAVLRRKPELIILLLILLLVSLPYISSVFKGFNELRDEQKRITAYHEQQAKEETAVKQQEDLIKKYKITTLEKSYSYVGEWEFPVYSLPEKAFQYLKTKQEIKNNKKGYICENPPSIETYVPKSQFFPDIDRSLEKFNKRVRCLPSILFRSPY